MSPIARLTVHTPAELVAAVPEVLGFQPTESMVVLGLVNNLINFAARIDLEHALTMPPMLTDTFQRLDDGRREFALIGYSDNPENAASGVVNVSESLHGPIVSRLLVRGDQVKHLNGEWTLISARLQGAVDAGLPEPMASRETVAASIAGPTGDDLYWAERAWRQHPDFPDHVAAAQLLVDAGLRNPEQFNRVCAALAALAADGEVRDRVVYTSLTEKTAPDHVALWRQVANHVPQEASAWPLAMLGMSAWVTGDGVLQVCALEHLTHRSPDNPVAPLLDSLNRQALPPDVWPEIQTKLLADTAWDPYGIRGGWRPAPADPLAAELVADAVVCMAMVVEADSQTVAERLHAGLPAAGQVLKDAAAAAHRVMQVDPEGFASATSLVFGADADALLVRVSHYGEALAATSATLTMNHAEAGAFSRDPELDNASHQVSV